jgi:hypothetical protein
MDFVYAMINDGEWEDIVIYLNKQDAIEASIKYHDSRIEIFGKNNNCNGYSPTYDYYKNGKIYETYDSKNENKYNVINK